MIGAQQKPLTAAQQKKLNASMSALGQKLSSMTADQLRAADPSSLSRSYALPVERVNSALLTEIRRR